MNKIESNNFCFFTQQVFLIGTYNKDGSENFALISWISYTCGEPACLVISIHGDKQTKRNIAQSGLLSATVLTPNLLPFAECCNNFTKNEELYKNGIPLFSRSDYTWWLTGFKPGMSFWWDTLRMNIGIAFPNADMKNAFCDSLKRNNVKYTTSNNTVVFSW
jgi:hypothetical protein